jgi:hypothetical protein
MLQRLLLGLVLGAVVGAAVAAVLVAGLHVASFAGGGGALLGYAAAALTGAVTGLVAGKPIWASGAKVEAGLKAFFGALLAAGAMLALRRWAPEAPIDLSAFNAGGPAPLAELPAMALPLIAAALGGLFGLDNTTEPDGGSARKRVASRSGVPEASKRAPAEEDEEEEASVPPRRARR